jgi:GDP-L-fucose synthase
MILVTGSTGFLGRRVCRKLDALGLPYRTTSLSQGTDLRDRTATLELFRAVKPTHVLNCAAFVGGIQFGYKNSAGLFTNNLLMSINLLEAVQEHGVSRLVNPISNCAYPGAATVFREDEFWDGPLHESVLVYGFVRKASWVGSWAFARQYNVDSLNLILSNMYGPEDHFEEERSHALGALVMKIARAKRERQPKVIVWGTGKPVREWLHVDDGAEAMVRGLDVAPSLDPINIGVGKGISIIELATMIKELIGYEGALALDPSKPDGAAYKTVDGSRGEQHFGWRPSTNFRQGVQDTVQWYLEHGARHD